jgi:hypothetical protein
MQTQSSKSHLEDSTSTGWIQKAYQTTETNIYGTAILPKIHFKTCPAKAS